MLAVILARSFFMYSLSIRPRVKQIRTQSASRSEDIKIRHPLIMIKSEHKGLYETSRLWLDLRVNQTVFQLALNMIIANPTPYVVIYLIGFRLHEGDHEVHHKFASVFDSLRRCILLPSPKDSYTDRKVGKVYYFLEAC